MPKQAEITYLFNSGFIVKLADTILVFDYFKDPSNEVAAVLSGTSKVYFFSSHVHFDHFSPQIASFASRVERYFLSFDIEGEASCRKIPAEKLTYLNAYDEYAGDGIKVMTYSSTDEGISFLVELMGWRIFHAGDFNWWHWEGDTQENILLARNGFMKQMKKLDGLKADIAFFPIDKRLAGSCDKGAKEFCRRTKIDHLITMHNARGSVWYPEADFLEQGTTSIWTPVEPGESIKIIK